MSTLPSIAIVEMSSQASILANLINIEFGVNSAVNLGATLVVLPENAFCFGSQAIAASQFEALADWASQLAERTGAYLLAGTLPCPFRPDGSKVASGKFRQSSLLFDPTGKQVARYDKIHLFTATVNDSTGGYDEGKTFEAGDTVVVAPTELGTIGMMVCFDLRFAPLALRLRELGADLITAPSAFTYQTGKAHWSSLLTARALDAQCLVIGAGQYGSHKFYKNDQLNERHTWGHSQIIDAHGECVSHMLMLNQNAIASFDFTLSKQAQTWLTADKHGFIDNTIWQNSTELTEMLANTRLITAKFDNAHQQTIRKNLPLFDCQRFTIQDPHTL